MKISHRTTNGYVLVYLSIIVFVFTLMMMPIIDILVLETKVLNVAIGKEQTLQIAEAGINYYQWHLAHYPNDYQDGTGHAGPYVHTYVDYDTQETVGTFSLTITPPPAGSTVVTIKSVGTATDSPLVSRTITAKFGIPSLAKYSFLSNDTIWIGTNESVSGQMQSNNGIRFDGVGNAPIQSAKSTYTCPSFQGSPCPTVKNGVWGSASATVQSFWQFPVPAVDFSSLTSNLASLKAAAQTSGIYLPPSNAQGYSLVFNAAGTVSIYKITALKNHQKGWDTSGVVHNEFTDYKTRVLQFTRAIPANGIIYVEDKTWVEGTVNGRAMVAASLLPYNAASAPTIYIPGNIIYAAKDGTNSLGLLAQKDIVVSYSAPNTLEIDAALISQNGAAQFFYYPNNTKTSITIFGSIMTFNAWTWTWVDGGGNVVSGYPVTTDIYDSNLLYAPPPSFPVSTAGYQQLSWQSN